MAVTIKDLAKMTGVSTSTISRVLSNHGYVSEEKRKIVEKAVEESGYVYKSTNSRRNSIDMVMLIIGEVSNEIYAQNLKGISSILDTFGIMYVGTYGDRFNAEKLESYMMRAIRNRFKGMILFSPIETPSFLRIMKNCSIPCVAMNRPVDSIEIDQVCMDNKAAGIMAVEYLAKRGHKHIAHIAITESSSHEYRLKGYIEGMKKAGLEVRDGDIIQTDNTFESGINAGSLIAVARKDITAVYAPNEIIARGVIEGLRRCGKYVPENVSIVATDNTKMSIVSSPQLTTVSCNHYKMGAEAAQLFMERYQNPRGKKKQIYFEPEIIERESVADYSEADF